MFYDEISLVAVIIATFGQFFIGALWYTFIFGKKWAEMHNFDKHDKKTQQEMQKSMMPLLAVQFMSGLVTTFVLAYLLSIFSKEESYVFASWIWFGFIVPAQISAVLFGGTEPKWIVSKIMIMAGGSLACIFTTVLIFNLLG